MKSVLNTNKRIREAGTVPFRSMRWGREEDEGTTAVLIVQLALRNIELNSWYLPPHLRPRGKWNGKRPKFWGPFLISKEEMEKRSYDRWTHNAVLVFQGQDGLKADGKAGIQTLTRLDEIVYWLENHAPPEISEGVRNMGR
jgi:hypothetical protein